MLKVEIFTDGACRGNPGPGGWGAVLRYPAYERCIYGAEDCTTNNRMELMAAISALKALEGSYDVILTTDSQYVKNGITLWMPNWKRRRWMTTSKKPVKNCDLWKWLEEEVQRHVIRWQWVRGHNGHLGNEKADRLANQAIEEWVVKR